MICDPASTYTRTMRSSRLRFSIGPKCSLAILTILIFWISRERFMYGTCTGQDGNHHIDPISASAPAFFRGDMGANFCSELQTGVSCPPVRHTQPRSQVVSILDKHHTRLAASPPTGRFRGSGPSFPVWSNSCTHHGNIDSVNTPKFMDGRSSRHTPRHPMEILSFRRTARVSCPQPHSQPA